MHKRTSTVDLWNLSRKASGFIRNIRVAFAAVVPVICLLSIALQTQSLQAAANPSAASTATAGPAGGTIPLAESLGVHFIPGSSSTVLIERDGKTYLVDLADRTIQEKDSPSPSSAVTPAHLESAHSSPPGCSVGSQDFRRQLRSLPRG